MHDHIPLQAKSLGIVGAVLAVFIAAISGDAKKLVQSPVED